MSTPEQETTQSDNHRKLEEFNSSGNPERRRRSQVPSQPEPKEPKNWRARWEEAKKLALEAEKKSTGKGKSPMRIAKSQSDLSLV